MTTIVLIAIGVLLAIMIYAIIKKAFKIIIFLSILSIVLYFLSQVTGINIF